MIRSWCMGSRGACLVCSCLALAMAAFHFQDRFADADHLEAMYNADTLTVPLYVDDLIEGRSVHRWSLPPSPTFVPDMLLYGTLDLLSGRAETMLLMRIYYIAWLLLFVLSWAVLLRVAGHEWWNAAVVALTLAAISLIAIVFVKRPILSLLLTPAHHSGVLPLWAIAVCHFIILVRGSASPLHLVSLSLVTIVAVASEPMFLFLFSAPAVLTAFVLMKSKKRALALSLLHCLAGYLALSATRAFLPVTAPDETGLVALISVPDSGQPWITYTNALAGISWPGLLLIVCMVVIISRIVFDLSERRKRGATDSQSAGEIPEADLILRLFALSAAGFALTMTVLTILSEGYVVYRWVAPGFTLVIWLLPFSLAGLVQRNVGAMRVAHFPLCVLIAIGPFFWERPVNRDRFDRAYRITRCLDAHRDLMRTPYGIAAYWYAKPVRAFSRTGLQANIVTPDAAIRHWMNNFDWYFAPDGGDIEYSFLIPADLEPGTVAHYAEGGTRIDCEDEEIWLIEPEKATIFPARKLELWWRLTGHAD